MPPAPPPLSQPALCIFDVCGTLYAANTTIEFLAFYHRANGHRARSLVCAALTHRLSPGRYAAHIGGKLIGRDLIRTALVRTLAGEARGDLLAGAHRYRAERLDRQWIAHSRALLDAHRAAGERVVLMSNSIEPVIQAIAAALGVEYHASTLAYDGDVCLGRIERDLTGRKQEVLARLVAEYGERPVVHVVTDNASDRALLDAADERTVIWQGRAPHAALADLEAAYVHVEG